MAKHNELGIRGENIACSYLQEKGYSVIDRNYVFAKCEIDIIAENEDEIVFIEVKTRGNSKWGNPEDAISDAKIKRIVRVADYYLNNCDTSKSPRFDVIAITFDNNTPDVIHIEDAFLSPIL